MRLRRLAAGVGSALLLLTLPTATLAATPAAGGKADLARHGHRQVTNATFGAAPASRQPGKGIVADGRPHFVFDVTPGGKTSDHVVITNYTRKREKLSVYTVDAVPSTTGLISFPSRATKPREAGAWMAVGTPHARGYIIAAPRSTTVLPVHVKVPANAPPGDHVGGVVVSLTGLAVSRFGKGGRQKVNFEQRIALTAEFRVAGPLHPNLTVQHLGASYSGPIDPFAKGSVTVHYDLHNGGNVVLGGPQSVTIHGLFGESVAGPHLADVPSLLPGATYPVTVHVKGVYPEVIMHATVRVDQRGLEGQVTPGLHPLSASVLFWAMPWIILLVILLAILTVAYRIWRRRRRRRAAAIVTGGGKHRAEPAVPQGA